MAGEDRLSEIERTQRNFIYLLIAVFGFLAFLLFRPFVSYILMAGLLVYLLHPIYRSAATWVRWPRAIALWLTILVLALIVTPVTWALYELARFGARLGQEVTLEAVKEFIDTIVARVYALAGATPETTDGAGSAFIAQALPRIAQFGEGLAPDLVTFIASLIVGVFVMLFVFYYGLTEGKDFVKWIMGASPLSQGQNEELLEEIRRTLDAVLLGQVVVSLVQGLLITIGFFVFGVPNAFLLGFLAFIFALLPVIGPPIVWLPAALWLAFTDHLYAAIGLVLWGAILVGFSDNLLRPLIVGSRARIHPVLVLVGVLGGVIVFGFVGFVLGPVVLAVLVAVVNFWRLDYLPNYERDLV